MERSAVRGTSEVHCVVVACRRRASSARKASPVESTAYGWHHRGTDPRPTAASQRWPSAPSPSSTDFDAGQLPDSAAPAVAAAGARERSNLLLPLPVAPTITITRHSVGQSTSGSLASSPSVAAHAAVFSLSPLAAEPWVPTLCVAHTIYAPGKRASSGVTSVSRSSTTSNSPPERPV